MSVTIAKKYLLLLQQIVAITDGSEIATLGSEAIPGSESVRVWLGFSQRAGDSLMSAIMRGLPHGEFGRIMPV
ncbi:MAG: hypothetical protein EKK46_06435 [Rhodocyclaceae bacterium]|nr:MAG: hypothetical protein EKK46_06435 [Rhodocyclaceae bacterium]